MSDDLVKPLADDSPAKTFPERLIGIFISPTEVLADVARKPDFVLPLIICMLAAITVTETILAKIGAEHIVRMALEQSGRASSMSPEQVDQAARQGASFLGVFLHIAGVVGLPIILLLIAGLGLLILNVVFSAPAKFKTIFSLVSYAHLVLLLSALMEMALIFFGDPERFDVQNPTPTTVGFFLIPSKVPRPLYVIASSFDLFIIWFVILVAIGLAEAVGRKVKPLPIFMIYAGLWIVWVLGRAGLAMIG
jgi:hypothetical protein